MSVAGRFAAHFYRLQDNQGDDPELLGDRLATAASSAIGAAGVSLSISVNGSRLPVGASNDQAVLAERLQFTTGDGPCLHVQQTGTTIRAGHARLARRWPVFHGQLIERTTFRAVFAVSVQWAIPAPVPFCRLPPGCMDVFFERDADLSDTAVDRAELVAGLITNVLTMSTANDGPAWFQGPPTLPRRTTMIALGLLSAIGQLSTAEALQVLRSYALSVGDTIDDIAHAIIDRRLVISDVISGPAAGP